MDGFTGFKTAAAEEVPHAVAVMDPFHVVRVRHEVLWVRMGVRDPCRLAVAAAGSKLRAARPRRRWGGWEAALTKPGRARTARWFGSGEQGRKV